MSFGFWFYVRYILAFPFILINTLINNNEGKFAYYLDKFITWDYHGGK